MSGRACAHGIELRGYCHGLDEDDGSLTRGPAAEVVRWGCLPETLSRGLELYNFLSVPIIQT